MGDYFHNLSTRFGAGWTTFWFTPRDPAPLAVLRWIVGALTLAWLVSWSGDVAPFFGPAGFLPLDTVRQLSPEAVRFSYFDYLATPQQLTAAHYAGLIVAGLFTVGFLTRVTSALTLLVALSYMHRGPLLETPFEPLLAMALLYLAIGPSGARWSVDRWLGGRGARAGGSAGPASSVGANIALRLVQVHFALLVLIMAWAKLSTDVWWNGTAMWSLATMPESRLVDLTGANANVFYLLTHAVVLFELTAPIFIWHELARPLLLAIGAVLWGILALVTGLVPYFVLLIALSFAFVPTKHRR